MGKIRIALNAIYKDKKAFGEVTQKSLAEALKCTQSGISQYLKGERAMSDDVIEGLCDALGVKLSDLENWNPELAKIRKRPTKIVHSACSENNPMHNTYHEMLESILHGKRKDSKKWIDGISSSLEAMSMAAGAPSGSSTPEGQHGSFSADSGLLQGDKTPVKVREEIQGKKNRRRH